MGNDARRVVDVLHGSALPVARSEGRGNARRLPSLNLLLNPEVFGTDSDRLRKLAGANHAPAMFTALGLNVFFCEFGRELPAVDKAL
jgi:hypothetical protein